MIPVLKPDMGEAEIEAVAEVIRSGWLGLGPKTAEFEQAFAAYLGANHAIGLNSGTSALDLSLRLLRISQHDEVIVPAITFVSTAHAVAFNLATPIFVDVDPDTLELDAESVAEKIGTRTKAIVAVHYGGRPVNFDKLRQVSGDLPIIEDAAHACGASYKGRKCGVLGDLAAFSFHAVKNLAMGDGGALIVHDKNLNDRAKRLRWLGIDKGTWNRTKVDRSYWWEYFVDEIGLKSHMNDIAAALGLVQLSKLDQMNERRRRIARRYTEAFGSEEWIKCPPIDDETHISSWHLYSIQCERRDELSSFLQTKGIGTGVHYKPIHLYRCYGNITHLEQAEKVFPKLLSLPMSSALTDSEVEQVIEGVRKFGRV